MLKRNKPFSNEKSPVLYLVGTPIGNLKDISQRAVEVLKSVDLIASEDTRNTSFLLKNLGIENKKLVSCYSQKEKEEGKKIINAMLTEGVSVAFVSDAGNPGISDPGAILCSMAIEENIPVTAVLGPSAFVQALITSGFDTSDFSFYGFLPVKENVRKDFLKNLKERKETLIFYESPHRIDKTLSSMFGAFGAERRVVISRELTKIHEEYLRGTLGDMIDFPEDAKRGEFVIIVEGAKNIESDTDDDKIIEYIKEYLEKGYSLKESVGIVSDELNLRKNYVYNIAKKI